MEAETRTGVIAAALDVARRRWISGAVVFLSVFAAVLAVLLLSKPIFRADARLRLGEPPPSSGVSPTAGFIGLLRLGGDPFANDLELLASRTVAEQVVDDVDLHARLDAAKGWYRDSVFADLAVDRTTIKGTYRIVREGDGMVVTRTSPRDSAIGRVVPGEPIAFDGVRAVFRPWPADAPSEMEIITRPFDDVAREVAKKLQIERTRREANVLSVAYEDADPAVARAAVAAAVRRFIELRSLIQDRESAETVDSLRAVAHGTQKELTAAEEALEDWQRQSRLIAPDAQGEAFVERYMAAIADRELATIEMAAIDSTLERLGREPDPAKAWVTLLAYPRFLENEVVGTLMARMSELEEERAELETRRAETSREAGALRQQIAGLDASLRQLASSYRTAVVERARDLDAQIARMDAELRAIPGDAVELMRRQRDVRLLSELVVLTEQRLRQEELRQALSVANVQVIDPPQLRRRQVWPRPKLGAAVGLVLAGGFGLLGMAAAERADPTVRGAASVRALTGAPVLATAVQSRRGVQVQPGEAAAIAAVMRRRAGGSEGTDPAQAALSIAPLKDEPALAVAQGLAASAALPALLPTEGVTAFGAASEAARHPVLLVVENGGTRRSDLAAGADRIREAGGEIVGSIVVCGSPREAERLWV